MGDAYCNNINISSLMFVVFRMPWTQQIWRWAHYSHSHCSTLHPGDNIFWFYRFLVCSRVSLPSAIEQWPRCHLMRNSTSQYCIHIHSALCLASCLHVQPRLKQLARPNRSRKNPQTRHLKSCKGGCRLKLRPLCTRPAPFASTCQPRRMNRVARSSRATTTGLVGIQSPRRRQLLICEYLPLRTTSTTDSSSSANTTVSLGTYGVPHSLRGRLLFSDFQLTSVPACRTALELGRL